MSFKRTKYPRIYLIEMPGTSTEISGEVRREIMVVKCKLHGSYPDVKSALADANKKWFRITKGEIQGACRMSRLWVSDRKESDHEEQKISPS